MTMFQPSVFLFAVLITALNCLKPVCVDDAYYLRLAREIRQHPAEPYGPPPDGFTTIWSQEAQGAFTILAPSVLPYSLAVAMSIFGDSVFVLKLALFPFVWLFVGAIASLAQRLCPRRRVEAVALIGFSAWALPGWNLMLDLPACSLGLTALVLGRRAFETRSSVVALVAGFLLGLAFETKYNSISFLGLLFFLGLRERRYRELLILLGSSLLLVLGWEGYLASIYGRSHLQFHLFEAAPGVREKRHHLVLPFIATLGGLSPFLWLYGLIVLKWLHCLLGGVVLLILTQLMLPVSWLPPMNYFFALCGILNLLLLFLRRRRLEESHRFLFAVWLLIEFLVALLFSPFCAARRLIGLSLALSLGYLTLDLPRSRLLLVASLFWAGFLTWNEIEEAQVEMDLVASLEHLHPAPRRWYCGHWGFSHEAEKFADPVLPGVTQFEKGDLIWVPQPGLRPWTQRIDLPAEKLELIRVHESDGGGILRTIPDWYGGKFPFQRSEGVKIRVAVFRVREAFLARSDREALPTRPNLAWPDLKKFENP